VSVKASAGFGNGGYWDHTLRDEDDFSRLLAYIHFNPVKHGYAPRVQDWPYSSFRRWVRLGGLSGRLGSHPGDRSAQPILRATRFPLISPFLAR
jgi:putative transposase